MLSFAAYYKRGLLLASLGFGKLQIKQFIKIKALK